MLKLKAWFCWNLGSNVEGADWEAKGRGNTATDSYLLLK